MDIRKAQLEKTKGHIQQFFDQYDRHVFGHSLEADKHADQLVLEAVENGQVVGGLIAKKSFASLHLAELAIDFSRRGSGIGTRLMEEMEKWAKEQAISVITVSTESYQAQAFYERFGYREFGRLKDMPFQGVDKIYMVKYIPNEELD
ncbi:GNAT family N-acetyltransferase [Streptococcus cameli]